MINNGISTFLALIIVSSTAIAAPSGDCGELLKKIQSEKNVEVSIAERAKRTSELNPIGWATRGFLGKLGGLPNLNSAETFVEAMKNGLMWWSFRFIFVNSLEEAIAHNAKIENRLMKGAYIIGSDANIKLKDHEAGSKRIPIEGDTLKDAIQKAEGFYTFDMNEKPQHVSYQEALERLDFKLVSRIEKDKYSHEMPIYNHEGWTSTKIRGVLDYADWFGPNAPSAITKYRNLARSLVEAGYRMVVNVDYQKSLNMARDQIRGGAKGSRYNSPVLYAAALEMYNARMAFSAEFYSPENELLGGSINFENAGKVSGDTVFYKVEENVKEIEVKLKDGKTKKIAPIDWARMVDIVTMDYMASLGYPIMDIGMVSDYSITLGGKEILQSEFQQLMSTLPNKSIPFPTVLDPFQYPDLSFKDLIKSAEARGITKAKFLGGLALPTEHAIKKAKEFGLKPFDLKIYVVPTMEALKELASKLVDSDALIYVGTADASPNQTMQKVVLEGARLVLDSKTTKLIKPEQIKNVINPLLSKDYLTWENSEFGLRLSLKGWALGR